jgi:microcystin-dependent protein
MFGTGAGQVAWTSLLQNNPANGVLARLLAIEKTLSGQAGLPPALPSGMVIHWYGDRTKIPVGWALCDGTNGQPDLRDLVIIGAGKNFPCQQQGGEPSNTLTQAELPAKGVTYRDWYYPETVTKLQSTGATTMEVYNENGNVGSGSTDNNNSAVLYKDKISGNMGSGQAHNNMQPYIALWTLIKL